MKLTTILFVFSLFLFANVCKADLAPANAQNTQALTIQKLQQFQTNNRFAYGSASDATLQEHILKTTLINLLKVHDKHLSVSIKAIANQLNNSYYTSYPMGLTK